MKVLGVERKFCTICMTEHDVQRVIVEDNNIFKGVAVTYPSECYYCENEDEYYEEDEMINKNGLALRNAYRKKMGLLTTDQIAAIRSKYGITQSDLCTVLGWGEKTITRYEGFQVQDAAHDSILRELDSDPSWYISLLDQAKNKLSDASYKKYSAIARKIYAENTDIYIKRTVYSRYARLMENPEFTGNTGLSLDKAVDVIRYISDAGVSALYKVKMMKMLWYSDALSYKRYTRSITGMVYVSMQMGAVPVAYDMIIKLSGVNIKETEYGDYTKCQFLPSENREYTLLTDEDKSVLDAVIDRFRRSTKDEIVNAMHKETAFIETAPNDIIQYKYAKDLSLD